MGVASKYKGTRRLRDAKTNMPLILDCKPLCICYYANVRWKNKCIEQHMEYLVRKELLPSKLGKYKIKLHTRMSSRHASHPSHWVSTVYCSMTGSRGTLHSSSSFNPYFLLLPTRTCRNGHHGIDIIYCSCSWIYGFLHRFILKCKSPISCSLSIATKCKLLSSAPSYFGGQPSTTYNLICNGLLCSIWWCALQEGTPISLPRSHPYPHPA